MTISVNIEAVMATQPYEVVPTSEARKNLSGILGELRKKGANADPVVFGSHRKPEGVMLSYLAYVKLLDLLDDMAIAAEVTKRLSDGSEPIEIDPDDLARDLGIDPQELRKDESPS